MNKVKFAEDNLQFEINRPCHVNLRAVFKKFWLINS